MRSVFLVLITSIFIACTPDVNEIPAAVVSDSTKLKTPPTEQKIESKKLLEASFTEPFMYAEVFSDKINFIRPEKDTLQMFYEFDPLVLTKNLKVSFTQNTVNYDIELIQTPCTHPGSGETWPITAKFMINGISYQGCAKPVK